MLVFVSNKTINSKNVFAVNDFDDYGNLDTDTRYRGPQRILKTGYKHQSTITDLDSFVFR